MRFIEHFLRRNQVDIGHVFGLLSFTGAALSFYRMAGQILVGSLSSLDLGAPLGIILGIALWRHRPWARRFVLILGWLGMCALLLAQLLIPLFGNQRFTLTIGPDSIHQPPEWMVLIWGILMAPPFILGLSILHSDKAKEEFSFRPARFDRSGVDIFHPLPVTLFLVFGCVAALGLNSEHTSYGASGICMNAGSRLTPASNIYYRDAIRALLNHLSASGFTTEAPTWQDGQPFPLPVNACYLKQTDKMGRVLHLSITSAGNDVPDGIPSEFRITVGYSYFIHCWNWEDRNFDITADAWNQDIRKWWSQYRLTHPTDFHDIADASL